jgi:serine/threonine protein kinase
MRYASRRARDAGGEPRDFDERDARVRGRGVHAGDVGTTMVKEELRWMGVREPDRRAHARVGRDSGKPRAREEGEVIRKSASVPVWAYSMEDERSQSRRSRADEPEEPTRRVWLGRNAFDVARRYEPIRIIGKGAYGVVCSAYDAVRRRKVAIKKLHNCFDSAVEARRALREVHLLRRLSHDNVIELLDVMMPLCEHGMRSDVYLVYELMDTDLHQIIRSKQDLLDEHCQYFVYQILRGLKYIQSADILHRDLKPSNILLNANCDLKICDFGLARRSVEQGKIMTSYVVTRWYRAPELLLNSEDYATSIDMWSVGCILAEILGRKPLFPGRDFIHQMRLIIEIIGSPEERDMNFLTSQYARRYITSLPPKKRVSFAELYPDANPHAIDLLERLLLFNPHRRLSVCEALEHPYFASLHDESLEPTFAPNPRDWSLGSMDEPDAAIPDDQLRDAIFQQMHALKSDVACAME